MAADGKGFPDLLMVRERIVAVEVKGDGDKLSPEQEAWLEAFEKAGVETHVWKTKDWTGGQVELVLR